MFKIGALTGFGGGGGGPVAIVGSVVGNVSSTPGTTHSLGNIDVGASSSDKNCFVMITWTHGNQNNITSLTVGGVSLSEKVSEQKTVTFETSAIWAGDLSSKNGSQAISVTFNLSVDSAGASAVSVSGLVSLTATDTADNNTTGNLTLIGISANTGGILLAASCQADRTITASWSAMTEREDKQTGTGSAPDDHRHNAAWDLGFRASANEIITFSGSDAVSGVAASFR